MNIRQIAFTLLIGTIIGLLDFTFIFYSEQGNLPVFSENWPEIVCSILFALLGALGISRLRKLLNQWIPWQQTITFRFIAGVITGTLLMLLILLMVAGLYIFISKGKVLFLDNFPVAIYYDAIIKVIILSFITVFIYTIIDFTIFSYNAYAEVQIESVKLTQAQLALQLQILKNQLSPHYLFNSLNTISSLIYKDVRIAEGFIRKLAQTYQYILSTQDKSLVSLSEEVMFLKAYLFLLKSRFEDAIEININLPPQVMESKIPPLTLQLLVENAMKHNMLSSEMPLLINVYLDMNDWITVSNTIQENTRPHSSFKIGLDNIKQRYQFQTSKQIEVIKDAYFTVKLPLLA